MFGVSFLELVVILVVALVVFGPEKLPEIARWVGKVSGEFRKTSNALRREFYNAVYEPAQTDLDRTRRELSSLKSELLTPFKEIGDSLKKDTRALGISDPGTNRAAATVGSAVAASVQPAKKPAMPAPTTPVTVSPDTDKASPNSDFDRSSEGDS